MTEETGTSGSSLKDFNFDGMTTEQIINKYEVVLANREKQILDLTIEIGNANSQINKLNNVTKNTKINGNN